MSSETETEIVRFDPASGERFVDHWAAGRLVNAFVGDSTEATKAQVRKELIDFARDLAGPSPSPTELILAQTAAVNWLALRTFEAQYMGMTRTRLSAAVSEHHQRRIDRTHRRLMSTIKTLALVRRAGIPAVQVNIARVDQPGRPGNRIEGDNLFDIFSGPFEGQR